MQAFAIVRRDCRVRCGILVHPPCFDAGSIRSWPLDDPLFYLLSGPIWRPLDLGKIAFLPLAFVQKRRGPLKDPLFR
jgi:hypothetical protein